MALLKPEDRKYTTPEDICMHLGDEYDKFCGAIVPPIFQNSLFVQHTEINGVPASGYYYTRDSNPTVDIVERKVAALEGADGAVCFGSGMAAISTAVLYCVSAGGHIILLSTSYGGTMEVVTKFLHDKFNIEYTLVDGDSTEEIEAAIRPNTQLICLESPSSIVFRMQDLDAVSAVAKKHGIKTVIDGTYGTPLHQQPLKHGIDIVCHTASKYLGGHSDIVAGVLSANEKIITDIQRTDRVLFGGIIDPHQAWLMLRGMRTLPIRLKQHGENGKKVAEFLENHPKVEKVFYPGSATYSQPELFNKYLSGTNGLMSFAPKGGQEAITKIVNSLHHFQHGCSWGGFESLCIPVPYSEVKDHGETHRVLRLHVGLENIDTLIADLAQALDKI
ncbi:MAG: PLP-dependent transferase [Oscillospiraceae bacterium]|nr:PLP-dependent transferase [Oscillospiraceae bacterium]